MRKRKGNQRKSKQSKTKRSRRTTCIRVTPSMSNLVNLPAAHLALQPRERLESSDQSQQANFSEPVDHQNRRNQRQDQYLSLSLCQESLFHPKLHVLRQPRLQPVGFASLQHPLSVSRWHHHRPRRLNQTFLCIRRSSRLKAKRVR